MNELLKIWSQSLPNLLNQFKGVMVACSAGVDSTVLLHLLYYFFKNEKIFSKHEVCGQKIYPLAIFHMAYGLRGQESEDDLLFLEKLANEWGLEIFVRRPENAPKGNGSHIQSWARQARYAQLEKFASEGWLIAFAHHQDDLAENIILRLARGVSPGSLAGMSELHGSHWRPLLPYSKKQLEDWALRHNLPHRDDASNATMKYSRNVIRHQILPELEKLYPGAKERIVRCALETKDFVKYSHLQLAGLIGDIKNGGASLEALASLQDSLLCETLSCAIGRRKKPINHNLLASLVRLIKQNGAVKKKDWTINISAHEYISKKGNKVLLLTTPG
jgi:tRNA(Ile)-lysidine synthetase-like protein